MKRSIVWAVFLAVALALPSSLLAAERLKLSSTTSTDNTGLLAHILPVFEKETGIRVDVIAVGTGKALKLAENGDVDVTLVHAPSAEKAFMKAGYGVNRRKVMANYFVIVGPPSDPAKVGTAPTVEEAFKRIARDHSPFISRGDNSGTHIKEQHIWRTVLGQIPTGRDWYLEAGKGMGETLTLADEKMAYTLSDSGTYLKYADKVDLKMLFKKPSKLLYNPYGIMAVNPEKHPYVNYKGAMKLIEWITGKEGQKLIGEYEDKLGNRLFTPLAGGKE